MVAFVLGNVVLVRFVGSVSWGGDSELRSSDDVSQFLGGSRHGRCSRAMTSGLEMCVLDDVNTWSVPGSGCESFWRGQLYIYFDKNKNGKCRSRRKHQIQSAPRSVGRSRPDQRTTIHQLQK